MRRSSLLLVGFGLATTAAGAVAAVGCGDLHDDQELELTDPSLARPHELSGSSAGTGGQDGGGGAGGSGGGGMGGGGKPGICVPSENMGLPVAGFCGVFVSSSLGEDTNAGTQAKPFKSITAALAATNGMPIYVCGEPFSEPVTVSAAVTIYGALDCSKGWAYDATTKTQLTAAVEAVPLTLASSANGAEVLDFAITAASAMKAGGSSIAVLADQATATLTRCDLVAGSGAMGAAGTTPNAVGPNDEGQAGVAGTSGGPGCTSSTDVLGGGGAQGMCGMIDVSGGLGGDGTNTLAGGAGTAADGAPEPGAVPPADGLGGSGQAAGVACKSGDDGPTGSPGMSGAGATGVGTIGASGYTGPAATNGQSAGTVGYGGGGGGGASKCGADAGPSGGGGGSGGCGGAPGTAGGPGGSSIALLSYMATLTLSDVTLTSGAGGGGGIGGSGQPGGNGGNGGPAGGPNGACAGGNGGLGGRGGSAGGGLGGHSLGIAFLGQAPMQTTNVMINDGSAGPGAIGGDGDATLTGDNGVACKTLNFADASSCM
jgi:hypothetical protein